MRRARPPLTARRLALWLLAGAVGLVVALLAAASFGAAQVSLGDLVFGGARLPPAERSILLAVRLPRVLVAALVGGALATAGAAFQALLRNPLADPYVLGVSGGASLGGVVALVSGLAAVPFAGGLAVPLCAFGGALGTLFVVERLATSAGRLHLYTLLLTGAICNAFSAALIFFLQSVASAEQLHAIVFYLMGRVPSLDWGPLAALAALLVAACFGLVTRARDFNALALGEEPAQQLGVEVERLKRWTYVLGSLATALAVSAAGLIGFVGLVVPHAVRLVGGPDHRLGLPASFLGGAIFLVLADLAARLLLAPNELPVGVVTALLGGPFFIYLLRQRGAEGGGGRG